MIPTSVSASAGSPKGKNLHAGTLHLTTIEEQFDETCDIALGPHCFIGRENILPDWQELDFVDAFPDGASLETAEKNVRGLTNYLLPKITQRLNAHHDCDFSIDFWRILVLPWLLEVIQRTWVSFTKLKTLNNRYAERTYSVKICQDDIPMHIEDTAHLLDKLLKDYQFNWWIDSEVASALSPPNWCLDRTDNITFPSATAITKPAANERGYVRNLLRRIKYSLGYSDIMGLRWGGLLLAIYVNLLPKRRSKVRFQPSSVFIPEQFFPANFLGVLNRILDATMPKSFLDGFPMLLEKAQRLPYRPGRLRLGTLSFWNEQEKVIAALAKENGEKRVVVQHGGEYGMVKYNIMANEMELRSTIFISWGWSCGQPEDGYVLPLPSPYHSKIANLHKRQNDSLIVIGQAVRIHLNRLHWSCRSSLPLWYCKDVVNFLGSLSQTIQKNVLFRPHSRVANDIEARDVVREHFPEMPILKTDLNKALLKCRLVVLNTFSTTINFTMAANVPTVAYMPPNIMKPRDEAEPYFAPLRKCGVIHETADEAAAHIEAIWDDVEGWWNSSEVQAARKIWTDQYALTDRFWWWQWIKALSRLKEVG